jgi:hypothetical protein
MSAFGKELEMPSSEGGGNPRKNPIKKILFMRNTK